MKIAILSDFHLGYERFRDDAYVQAERALNKAAELADMMIIPGDIFDSRAPKPDIIAEAINLFRNLSRKQWRSEVTNFIGEGNNYTKVPIIAIPGTHERRAKDVADPVDILGLAGLVVDVSNATAIVERDGEIVAVRGIGGIDDDRFGETMREIKPVPVMGAFNIFMFHESLYELLPFNDRFVHYDELPKGFDLYVNGHMHNRTEADVHGRKMLIPGSTVLTQLKVGEQDPKGFWMFDTKDYTYEFIEVRSRRLAVLKISLGSGKDSDVIATVHKSLDEIIKSEIDVPIIRIVIEGKIRKDSGIELDINDMPRRYKDRAIVEVSKSRISDWGADWSETPGGVVFEKMSVRDYEMGIFLEKIRSAGIDTGSVSPAELLDMLGSDLGKEKVIANALDALLQSV